VCVTPRQRSDDSDRTRDHQDDHRNFRSATNRDNRHSDDRGHSRRHQGDHRHFRCGDKLNVYRHYEGGPTRGYHDHRQFRSATDREDRRNPRHRARELDQSSYRDYKDEALTSVRRWRDLCDNNEERLNGHRYDDHSDTDSWFPPVD